jgi:hypothetical protein
MALSVNNHIRFMRNIILPVNVNDVHCCNSGASLEVCPEPVGGFVYQNDSIPAFDTESFPPLAIRK